MRAYFIIEKSDIADLPRNVIKSMIDPALFSGSDYTLDYDKVTRLDRDRDSSSTPFLAQ